MKLKLIIRTVSKDTIWNDQEIELNTEEIIHIKLQTDQWVIDLHPGELLGLYAEGRIAVIPRSSNNVLVEFR